METVPAILPGAVFFWDMFGMSVVNVWKSRVNSNGDNTNLY